MGNFSMKTLFYGFPIDEKFCNLSGVVLLCNSPKKIEIIPREKRRTKVGIQAVVRLSPKLFPAPMSVISRSWLPSRLEGGSPRE